MDEFIKARDEYISKIRSLGHRHLHIDRLKSHLRKMGYPKRCLWCGAILEGRKQSWCCDEHSNNFYDTYHWGFIRDDVLKEHPVCQICGEKESKEVHHKEPIKELAKYNIRGDPFDEDNLIALCHDCHIQAHRDLKKKYAPQIIRAKMKSPGLKAFGLECLEVDNAEGM